MKRLLQWLFEIFFRYKIAELNKNLETVSRNMTAVDLLMEHRNYTHVNSVGCVRFEYLLKDSSIGIGHVQYLSSIAGMVDNSFFNYFLFDYREDCLRDLDVEMRAGNENKIKLQLGKIAAYDEIKRRLYIIKDSSKAAQDRMEMGDKINAAL